MYPSWLRLADSHPPNRGKHKTTKASHLSKLYLQRVLPLHSLFTRCLVFNVFQRTSANYHWTSWDFHLAQLITLSSQVHYHIPPFKKRQPTQCNAVCVRADRCKAKCAVDTLGLIVGVCARLYVLSTFLIASGSAVIRALMKQSIFGRGPRKSQWRSRGRTGSWY